MHTTWVRICYVYGLIIHLLYIHSNIVFNDDISQTVTLIPVSIASDILEQGLLWPSNSLSCRAKAQPYQTHLIKLIMVFMTTRKTHVSLITVGVKPCRTVDLKGKS